MTDLYDKETLTRDDISTEVRRRLEKYGNKSFLECFAMYLGTAQILEFGLKGVLISKFGIAEESLERATMGQAKNQLRDKGVRADYISYLDQVVTDRNHAAHELIRDKLLLSDFGGGLSERLQFKEL